MRHLNRQIIAAAALLLAGAAQAAPTAPLVLDRVVLLMRHGVRPPTKAPPMPAGVAAEAWPTWPVAPGWLTPHGADAVRGIADADRAALGAAGLFAGAACPAPGTVRVVSDSDQRTIATGDAWLAGFARGCGIANAHLAQDVSDPFFSPIDEGVVTLDPARANAAVADAIGPGGIAAVAARMQPLLTRLNAILCGPAQAACGIGAAPSGIAPAAATKRPKLTGALDRGSTVAQILLLEYADGKPLAEVGWGRATAADVTAASALHALEFGLLARPRYIAAHNLAKIGPWMLAALTEPGVGAARVALIVGHDTNVAALGGLLDLHWQVPGLAADDPAPGGALGFERLHDARGNAYVRAVYRSQTLDQLRTAGAGQTEQPYRVVIPIPGCTARGDAGLCTLADFERVMRKALAG